MQTAVDQLLEGDAVVGRDVIEADVDFFFVVLGAEIDGGSGHRQRAEPVLCRYMGDILHHFDDAFAGAALSGEQPYLLEWHPVRDSPFALWPRLVVPIGHIEPSQWRPRFFLAEDSLDDIACNFR